MNRVIISREVLKVIPLILKSYETRKQEIENKIDLSGYNLSGIRLRDLNLSHLIIFEQNKFVGAKLTRLKLDRISFRKVDFRYCIINTLVTRESLFFDCLFEGVTIYRANFSCAQFIQTKFMYSKFTFCNFKGANFDSLKIHFSNLEYMVFDGNKFSTQGAYEFGEHNKFPISLKGSLLRLSFLNGIRRSKPENNFLYSHPTSEVNLDLGDENFLVETDYDFKWNKQSMEDLSQAQVQGKVYTINTSTFYEENISSERICLFWKETLVDHPILTHFQNQLIKDIHYEFKEVKDYLSNL